MRNTIRIIGGTWRGRKLSFPPTKELRPTPDRVRETLFNWLSPYVMGARCLDLFSGSGALGFEALSRGATHVVMVDSSQEVILQLQANVKLLRAENITVVRDNIPTISPSFSGRFDIVFLDPPYHKNLVAPCCEWLEKNKLLTSNALVYIETESTLDPLPLPSHWELFRSKKTGNVGYHLARIQPNDPV